MRAREENQCRVEGSPRSSGTGPCRAVKLGLVDYIAALDLQESLVLRRIEREISDTVLLLEHDPVITLGAYRGENNVLVGEKELELRGIRVVRADRGGDVTYHGPGQLVVYPILDLKLRGCDLHRYVHQLEEAVIRTLRDFGLEGERDREHPGVWVGCAKVCAVGFRVRRWVSKHGLALNVNNDLSPFSLIVPCGITGRGATSMSMLLGRHIEIDDVSQALLCNFSGVFGVKIEEIQREEL